MIHFLFWVRYFVADQFTFVLPSTLLAYLIAADALSSGRCAAGGASPCGRGVLAASSRLVWVPLFALQLLLPVAAWGVLSAVGFPASYCADHPGRDNEAYFALPWHVTDDSAARAAALRRTPWKGYP